MSEKSMHNENDRELPTEIDKIISEIVQRIKVKKTYVTNKKFYIRLYDNTTNDNETYNPQSIENAKIVQSRLLGRKDILLYDGKQESETSQYVSYYLKDF